MERSSSWILVKSILCRNMKSSGALASGAERHAHAACDHNSRMDIYIHGRLQTGVWQSCCEKLKRINGDERKKKRSN